MNAIYQLVERSAKPILLLAIVASLLPFNANAELFGWMGQNDNVNFATAVNAGGSFDELFEGVTNPLTEGNPLIQDSFVLGGTASHVTPNAGRKSINRKYVVEMSAYSSTPDQTDSSPFITAKGTYVRDGVVAANFLPFGTRFKIPSLYGDKVFIVEDRMNKRYWQNVDIWMSDRGSALRFGRRQVVIELLAS